MRRRTLLKLAGAAAAAEALAIACNATTAPTASPAATTAATAAPAVAKPSGTISVYSALNEATSDQLIAAFEAATPGVEVGLLPLAAAGELQTRIRAEKDGRKADVFVGGDSSLHDGLAAEGLLEPYTSASSSAIVAEAKDPAGFWAGWYFGVLGFVSNTDRLTKEIAGKRPKTWDDLLDPLWKGKLVLPDPVRTDGGYVFLATQVFRFNRDEAKALDYMKQLHPQVARYAGTASQGIQLVSQGQLVGGPSWSHDILTEKAKDPRIELTVPEETGFEIGAVSIIKGTKDLLAAESFVDWILTKEAGQLHVKLSDRLPVRKDVAPAPGAPTLDQVKLVTYDRAFAASNKDRLTKAWRAAVGL